MPYSITTKDGITINNIPDDIDPNADELKARVAEIRAGGADGISDERIDRAAGGVVAVQPDRQVDGLDAGQVGAVAQPVPEGFPGAQIIEPAAALISGAIAEPIAGIAGVVKGLLPGEIGEAARTVEATREALTFQPRTEEGRAGLEAVGEALQPVGEALKETETFLGDETFEATGSPALAAAATTLPTALLEALGLVSAKGAIKLGAKSKAASKAKEVKRAIVEAAPEIEQLKDASRAVFKEIDESGVVVKKNAFDSLVARSVIETRKAGFDPDLTPKTAAVLNRLKSEAGSPKSITDIVTLRKVAGNAAKSIEPADAALGRIIIEQIDTFLDDLSPSSLKAGKDVDVGPRLKVANELWGRARRSELINDAFEKAKNQASGFENGIVVQFRSILNNKKKARFFKPKEIAAMQRVVRGTTKENIAKLVGRLGFSEGHATNIIGGSLGIAAGAALAGPVGAVAVPVIGQVSRKLAQRLTRNNAKFADAVVRAGDNAELITTEYLRNTPKRQRAATELSELLSNPDIALDAALESRNILLSEAAELARGNRVLGAVAASAAVLSETKELEEQ